MKRKRLSFAGQLGVLAGCCWLNLLLVAHLRAQTYNAESDFSLTSNPNGVWSYGTLSSLYGGTFTPFTRSITNLDFNGENRWDNNGTFPNSAFVAQIAPGYNANFFAPNQLHLDGEDLVSDVRWTAPATGTYNIAGYFQAAPGNEGVTVSIIQDFGTVLFTTGDFSVFNYPLQVFNFSKVKLSAGAVLDFVEGAGQPSEDGTGLALAITKVETGPNTVFATIPVGINPQGLAVSSDSTFVFVADYGGGNGNGVSILNAQTGQLAGTTLNVGGQGPIEVAVTPNGKFLYVSNFNSNHNINTVSAIPTGNIAFTTVISGPGLNGPFGIAVTPDGTQVYVANNLSNTVSVIETSNNQLSPTAITVGNQPAYVAFTPNGQQALVSNSKDNTVSVINVTSQTVGETITVGTSPQGIAILPNGNTAYVNTGAAISVIDIATKQVTSINVGGNTGAKSALTPDGKFLYVPVDAASGPGSVVIISTATGAVIGNPIRVGQQPVAVAISPDGENAYVTNYADSTVSVIQITTKK
ncbi:MAG: YncE family protein [Verrucomicrobia bacterium]|nr:YncE family protein [Verrucomicrobiota bacterium]